MAHRWSFIFAFLLVVSACSTVTFVIPQLVGYVAVVGVSVVIVVAALHARGGALPLRVHPALAIPLVVLWILFVIALVRRPTPAALKRVPVFIAFSALCVFVFPAVLDRTDIERALAWVGVIATLVALPAVVVGPITFDGVTVIPVGPPQLPGGLNVATSVFTNPNQFAMLALFGTIGAASVAYRRPAVRRRYIPLAALCVVGLALTRGRAAYLALVCVVALAVVYRLGGRRALAAGMGALGIAAITCFAALMANRGLIVHTIAPVVGMEAAWDIAGMGNRWLLWQAALDAITAQPALGWGFVDIQQVFDGLPPRIGTSSIHNSYLRMFYLTGVVGGLAYLALIVAAGWLAVRDASLDCILFVGAVAILQLFEGGTIFGLSLLSVVGALFFGFTQPASTKRTVRLPAQVRRAVRRVWPRSAH